MNIDHFIDRFQKVDIDAIGQEHIFSNRKDVKYLIPFHLLPELLAQMREEYNLMTVNGIGLQAYSTYYYDTCDFKFYRDHHQGRQNRIKVRSRYYADEKSFFEMKRKTNRGMTMKYRFPLEVNSDKDRLDSSILNDLGLPEDLTLLKQLCVKYSRLSFFPKLQDEKVTLDLDLGFQRNLDEFELPSIVVAESKGNGQQHSFFKNLMRSYKINQSSFSKYCFGISKLVATVKKNNFKPLEHKIEKLIHAHELS